MDIRPILTTLLLILCPILAGAQKASPTATYVDENQNTVDAETDFSGQASLSVTFRANPTEMGEHTPTFEWHFRKEGETEDRLVRYEEETQYTFVESGKFNVILKTILTDTCMELEDSAVISVTISESMLEMPNAFSPDDNGINDIYRAKKDKYKSIVEFHAYIFNRWGQKLFEWTDITKGWDGTYKGSPVKEGVYYVLVKAKGADGREFNIKRDVNLLRGFSAEPTNQTP